MCSMVDFFRKEMKLCSEVSKFEMVLLLLFQMTVCVHHLRAHNDDGILPTSLYHTNVQLSCMRFLVLNEERLIGSTSVQSERCDGDDDTSDSKIEMKC